MSTPERIALAAALLFAYLAAQNSLEAHRHAHELACRIGAVDQ